MASPRLSTTSFAVLGLLTFGEMSGYDVLKLAEASIGHFWAPAKSHVYSELKRLAAAGLASARTVEQDARPTKNVYAITPEGEVALHDWLASDEMVEEQYRSVFLLKVFFGHLVPEEAILPQLEEIRASAEATLKELEATEEQISDDPNTFYPYLTLRAGLAYNRAAITWAEEALTMIERRREEAQR